MVFKWTLELQRGRKSPGRPQNVTTTEMINSVHHMVMDDKRLTNHIIAESMGISSERVLHILYNELGLRKLFAR